MAAPYGKSVYGYGQYGVGNVYSFDGVIDVTPVFNNAVISKLYKFGGHLNVTPVIDAARVDLTFSFDGDLNVTPLIEINGDSFMSMGERPLAGVMYVTPQFLGHLNTELIFGGTLDVTPIFVDVPEVKTYFGPFWQRMPSCPDFWEPMPEPPQ